MKAWCSVKGCNQLIDDSKYYDHMDTHSLTEILAEEAVQK